MTVAPHPSPARSPHGLLRFASAVALAACLVPVLLGFGGRLAPALDSFSHFRAHLAVLALLSALLLLLAGSRRAAAWGALAALLALATTLPAHGSASAAAGGGPSFRLLHFNLRVENETPDAAIDLLRSLAPDVAALNEVSDEWGRRLEALADLYPFRMVCPRVDYADSVALLSRHPWTGGVAPHCAENGAFAAGSVAVGATVIDIAAVHLKWPWPCEGPAQIERLTPEFGRLGRAAVVAGDFNAVPWSAAVRQVERAGGLALVRGYGPTWLPKALPRALLPLGLPIDQVFSKGLVLHEARTLPPVGSDHLAVLVEFSLP